MDGHPDTWAGYIVRGRKFKAGMPGMKVVYDPDRNILQIALKGGAIAETAQVAPNLVLDYDEDGQVMGLELRNASETIENPYAVEHEVGPANVDKPQPYTGK
jgi:uncharacterized protein YuzE